MDVVSLVVKIVQERSVMRGRFRRDATISDSFKPTIYSFLIAVNSATLNLKDMAWFASW